MKVYYLDDEPALCFIFEESFTTDDIEITTFTSAKDAIAACETNPPDVIFIDMRLEDTTGNKVAEQLSDSITKYLVTGDLVNSSDFTFEAVIHKPFDIDEVASLIRKLRMEESIAYMREKVIKGRSAARPDS